MNENILASRYCSQELRQIWEPTSKIIEERKLWVAILRIQKDLGLDIVDETITAYEQSIENVDLDSIARRESLTQHDVKARIEEFSALASKDQIHLGLTSRDITENVEQVRILKSAALILKKAVLNLQKLTAIAQQHKSTQLVARTHNMAAQATTLGRKYAMLGEEFMGGISKLKRFIEEYRFRGIKGAVGTQSDLYELFDGNHKKIQELDKRVVEYLSSQVGKSKNDGLNFTGQIYPRSLDYDFAQNLVQLIASPANFAVDLRLMAGQGLIAERKPSEGSKQEVGSSAMPHKVNPSLCERIEGMAVLVKGYCTILQEISGTQWNEGDVSCSVVRRVALPDICFATEGLLNTYQKVLDGMWVNTEAMEAEVQAELSSICSSTLLMKAVKAGMGRETAYDIIKAHIYNKISLEDLIKELDQEKDFVLNKEEMLSSSVQLFEMAQNQTEDYLKEAEHFLKE